MSAWRDGRRSHQVYMMNGMAPDVLRDGGDLAVPKKQLAGLGSFYQEGSDVEVKGSLGFNAYATSRVISRR